MSSDYAVFASEGFDSNDYANAILAGEPYPTSDAKRGPGRPSFDSPSKEDVSVAISRLTYGIDDVSKQIKNLVTSHHEDLLSQAASANELSGSLVSVKGGLSELEMSLEKLRTKVRLPYQSLQTNVNRLHKLQQASDVLRRTARFVVLARRLQGQMAEMQQNTSDKPDDAAGSKALTASTVSTMDLEDDKERAISRAALSIAELVTLLDGPSTFASEHDAENIAEGDSLSAHTQRIHLRSVKAVAVHIPLIEESRTTVTTEMENMVVAGLASLNQSLLASSLQTAFNLNVLPELVQSLISDLSLAVGERIRTTFDMSKISKDALGKDSSAQSPTQYRSRIRTEPTNLTAPQWTAALWTRLESMVEEMAGCCIKVYTLEKVLKVKKDTVSQTVFLDEAMKLLETKPSVTFWTALSRSLEQHAKESAKGSTFMQQTLGGGYPRLLRLFHQFFAKIAVHTDTVYIQSQQSPETILVLRALSTFETFYLTRSTSKLNEAVGQAFRVSPGATEGTNVARTVVNELDSARFDPLLVRAVARNAAASLDMFVQRADAMVVRDRSALTLVGPSCTPQQAGNAQVASCLFHCRARLVQLEKEHIDAVCAALRPSIENMHRTYERVVDPLLSAIRRELTAIIARVHRFDFGRAQDPMSGGGASLYMKDLVEKLAYVKGEVLSKFNVDDKWMWIMSIVKYVIKVFVLHISIAKPLGESGKLQLASDMAELEFGLNAFMADGTPGKRGGHLESIGDEYRMLRAMRPLLFLDNAQLASPAQTAGLPPLIVLHHILVRSPVSLPHTLHGWQEAEYVRWVDEHTEEEAWTLMESGLSHWEQMSKTDGTDSETAAEYVELARTVLTNAQGNGA
ncbi:Golgi transport complex subunit 5-domain-containing protein [Schizophyllum amplum]|uniref:Conserved oligomeric Golgi complex subunit 5 n=1 Tax=Schizophyllum amplum TaxID=97359 RepID=A0A550CY83_9AGAR|nr:Golgi transport complex subunit 5-domain-containing protein [Auriculariopsis ampla]